MATKNDKGVTKTTLPIDSLNTKAGTQLRALDTKVAGRYCEDMQDGDTFPAVTVYSDGTELWLVDGFHRWHASVKAGFTEISAEVHEGKTLRDALFAACAANHGHGLQRNYADIAKSVRLLLRDPEWSLMSDRAISEHVRGISHTTVGKFRTEELGEAAAHKPRLGLDGKTRRHPRPRTEPVEVAEVPVSEEVAAVEAGAESVPVTVEQLTTDSGMGRINALVGRAPELTVEERASREMAGLEVPSEPVGIAPPCVQDASPLVQVVESVVIYVREFLTTEFSLEEAAGTLRWVEQVLSVTEPTASEIAASPVIPANATEADVKVATRSRRAKK